MKKKHWVLQKTPEDVQNSGDIRTSSFPLKFVVVKDSKFLAYSPIDFLKAPPSPIQSRGKTVS
jgi:hypothetical protein